MSFTVNGTTGITFPNNTTQNTAASGYAFHNRLINGDMRIDQRNAGASVTPASGAYTYTLDRWAGFATQSSKYTVQQNAGSVTPPTGFTNYLGVTSSSAYSVTSSDLFMLTQYIEGFNTADLGFGASGASTVTLSFWVRSSLTGTFGGAILNSAQNRVYPFTYTISAANTWEQKSVTIAGDTSGTWLKTNGVGIQVNFGLGAGSNNTNTAGAWTTSGFTASGATSVVGTSGATFYLTGVQLEKDSVATSFDYRPYGTELALCQRYYQISIYAPLAGRSNGTTTISYSCALPVSLRTAPTVTDGGTCYAFSSGARTNTTGGSNTVPRFGSSSGVIYLNRSGFSGLTDDRVYNLEFTSDLTLSSEL